MNIGKRRYRETESDPSYDKPKVIMDVRGLLDIMLVMKFAYIENQKIKEPEIIEGKQLKRIKEEKDWYQKELEIRIKGISVNKKYRTPNQ
jgi:hypothetical protein